MDQRDRELLQRVKDRFLAACREIILLRLKDIQDRFPEVDVDLLLELVILVGVGFINRMNRQDGHDKVTELFDELLKEITILICANDEKLLEDITKAAEFVKRQAPPDQATVPAVNPLPGVGLFGFKFPKEEN